MNEQDAELPLTLSENEKGALHKWCDKMAKKLDIDKQEITGMILERFDYYSKVKSLQHKPKNFIIQRVINHVSSKLRGVGKLETFHVRFIGAMGWPTDWNKKDIKAINDEAGDCDYRDLLVMANEGKIASIEELDESNNTMTSKVVIISKLLAPMYKDENKNWHVREYLDPGDPSSGKAYIPWKVPGDPVVPLDTREKIGGKNNRMDNWNKGNALKPSYTHNLFGTCQRKNKDGKWSEPHLCSFNFGGDHADPSNEKFIEKGMKWGAKTVLKATFNEARSDQHMWSIKCRKHIKKHVEKLDGYKFYKDLQKTLLVYPDWTGDPFDGKDLKFYGFNESLVPGNYPMGNIPVIDLEHLREWHVKMQMKFGENNDEFVRDDGTVRKNYNRIAAIDCTISPRGEPKEGNSISVDVSDSSFFEGKHNCFLPNFYTELPFKGVADVIMFVTTKEGKDYYDVDLNARIEGDIHDNDINLQVINFITIFEHPPGEETEEEEIDEAEVEINV